MNPIIRLTIVVEGRSEETFVDDVLAPALSEKMIFATPWPVGGISKYSTLRKFVELGIKQDKESYLSTMFDFYALPKTFPGKNSLSPNLSPWEKVRHLENAFANEINSARFIPYIQLHEFEGLLFTDINQIDAVLAVGRESQLKELMKIRNQFQTPEEINDRYETAPSRRLSNLYQKYQKVTEGVRIIEQIGLERLRQACPHFHEWVTRLETLVKTD